MNENERIEDMAEALYTSPIELTEGDFYMQQDEAIYRAIYELGIVVDKDELIKALRYDREQYVRGFVDGCWGNMDEIKAEVAREIFAQIQKRFVEISNESNVSLFQAHIRAVNEIERKYMEAYDEQKQTN